MKGLREIKGRIRSVKNTGQITRAMQLVASSKMKKAQNSAEAGRAYTLFLMDLIDVIDNQIEGKIKHPLFSRRDVKKRLIIVFSTDRGLCGILNTNLFKTIVDIVDECEYIAIGNKAARFLSRTKRNMVAQFKVSDFVKFSEIKPIVELAIDKFIKAEVDTIEVLYPSYINTITQESTLVQIAPVSDLKSFVETMIKKYKSDISSRPEETREIVFEPSLNELLDELPLYYLKNVVYHMALDAKASEQSARMVAMKNASDNAKALIDSLTLEFNKARQSAITTEITELSAAAMIVDK